MHFTFFFSAALLLLNSTVRTATIDEVIASNNNLTKQADIVDADVVNITAQTPPADAQQIPPSLESLTNSISSNHSALDPTPPTSDPPVEFNLVRSWGLFANTIEELMADYIQKKGDLIGVFGLRAAIHDRLVTFNESFQDYAAFMLTLVTDQAYKNTIIGNTGNATGNNDFGIIAATNAYS